MKIKTNEAFATISTDILGINNREMRQMCDMKDRIAQVLSSHSDEKVKNEYLSDNELKMLLCILHVLTKDFDLCDTSEFSNALKELEKLEATPNEAAVAF